MVLKLLILLLFGSGIAFLSLQNTTPVTVVLLSYTSPTVSLNYVIIGSILLGVLLAYGFHLIQSISTSFILRNKNKQLRQKDTQITELTKEVHQLDRENASIKKETDSRFVDTKSM